METVAQQRPGAQRSGTSPLYQVLAEDIVAMGVEAVFGLISDDTALLATALDTWHSRASIAGVQSFLKMVAWTPCLPGRSCAPAPAVWFRSALPHGERLSLMGFRRNGPNVVSIRATPPAGTPR